jgi:prophage maintenance system killer protein
MTSGTHAVILGAHNVYYVKPKVYGGQAGARDRGPLESALAGPQNQLAYGLAASYVVRISRNHPFLDGDKRSSVAWSPNCS